LLFLYEAITDDLWPDVGISLATFVFVACPRFGTGYRITASELSVKAGPFRWRVPLSSIRRIRRMNKTPGRHRHYRCIAVRLP